MTLAMTILALIGAVLTALGHPQPEKWQQGRAVLIALFWLGLALVFAAIGGGVWEWVR
jgi:apolipoprotein N-acyltransferase